MKAEPRIRLATVEDAPAILDIYAPYVTDTGVTFETTIPDRESFTRRVSAVLATHPYLVAEQGTDLLGFTYASPFRPRAAYAHAVEASIYIRRDYKGNGLGRRLYTALTELLLLQNVYNMNACIASIEPEDEYVPQASCRFHEKMGFTRVAHFDKCGRKFNRWYDMVWMQKIIAEHPDDPADFIPFPNVDDALVTRILENA